MLTRTSREGGVEDTHMRTLEKKVIGTDDSRDRKKTIWNTGGNIAVNRGGHTSKVKENTRDHGD